VGDWVIAERTNEHFRILKVHEAKNQLKRLSNHKRQLMAAYCPYIIGRITKNCSKKTPLMLAQHKVRTHKNNTRKRSVKKFFVNK
jgi:hypothetical protein